MGKPAARQRRELSGTTLNLFSANTALGWDVIRQVPVELALEKLAAKQWREVWLTNGELAGVQPLRAEEQKTFHQILVAELLAVTITLNELLRNAGCYGRSRTLGMPEWKRLRRHARWDPEMMLAPEDATERAIEKVRLWPYPASRARDRSGEPVTDNDGQPVFGDRAVRVYPPAPRMKRGQ
jgi:hypothetical protein